MCHINRNVNVSPSFYQKCIFLLLLLLSYASDFKVGKKQKYVSIHQGALLSLSRRSGLLHLIYTEAITHTHTRHASIYYTRAYFIYVCVCVCVDIYYAHNPQKYTPKEEEKEK